MVGLVGVVGCGWLNAIAGGSVTTIVFAGEVAVSPDVVLLAVRVRLFNGWSEPAYDECNVSPLLTSAALKVTELPLKID